MNNIDNNRASYPVITFVGWDNESQSDKLTPHCTLSYWLPVGGSEARMYSLSVETPENLWELLREFTLDFYGAAAKYWKYKLPEAAKINPNKPSRSIRLSSISLSDL